jgi:hypothetical protein
LTYRSSVTETTVAEHPRVVTGIGPLVAVAGTVRAIASERKP